MSETALRRSKSRGSLPPRYDLMLLPSWTRTSLPTKSTPARCRSHILYLETLHCRSRALYTVARPCSDKAPQRPQSSHAHSRCQQRHRCDLNCPLCQTSPTQRSSSMTCMERRKHCPLLCLHNTEPCDLSHLRSIAVGFRSIRLVPRTLRQPCVDHVHTHPRLMSKLAQHHSRSPFRLLRLVSLLSKYTAARPEPRRLRWHAASWHWSCNQAMRRTHALLNRSRRSLGKSTTLRTCTPAQNLLRPAGTPTPMSYCLVSLFASVLISQRGCAPHHTLRCMIV